MPAFALLLWALFAGMPESAVAAEVAPPAPPAAATIADTIMQIGKSERMERAALARLKQSEAWRELSRRTTALETEFDSLALDNVAQAELMELLGLEHQARHLKDDSSAIVDELASILRRLEQDGNELETQARLWRERLVFLHDRLVPAPVIERAQEVEATLRGADDKLRKVRDGTLQDLARALTLQLRVVEASALVNARLDHVRLQRMQVEESSLWQLGAAPSQVQLVSSELRASGRSLRQYLGRNGTGLAGLFFGVFAFMFWLFTKGALQDAAPAQRAYGRPVAASLLVALMSLWWLAPDPPAIFYEILLAIVPFPAAMIACRAFAAAIPLSLYGLALATSLLSLRNSIEASVIADRALLLLQAISIGVPVAVDLRRGRLQHAFARWSPDIVRIVALIAIALSVTTAWHVIFGFLGPARSLRAGTGSILGFSLVFGTTALVLYGAVLAILCTPVLRWLRSARTSDPALLRAVRLVLTLVTVIGVGLVTLENLGLVPALRSAIDSLMGSALEVGTVSISAKAVAAALAIALATLVLTMVIGFVLDREVFPRLQLRPGTGYAIATFTHWVLLIAGTALALAALGIDMAKVTLVAGALSVGIGFGLQSVVNNFVSGLILIVERPVGVGDLIEIGPLLGEIKRIGIRSSSVRTTHGAEVIVPNSDLVSKGVVNWTRSDRRRRYDIDVGVPSGSEPEQVMALLMEAAREVPEILTDPAPMAMFKGFSDKSLEFKLQVWVESIELELQAQNALRVAVLRKLELAGVTPSAAARGSPPPGERTAAPGGTSART
ncbi:mechanosensitive ion channel domain-containing protein [Variovorax sp. J31P207]|uniref:mechanosensitive ion channel domain-containing protein n=1 Tax=Variovorax sp. J31P207 TaxID=3053510 RepID=UPI002574DBC9|nr:mechanosensitive ion channel domain-containing protein [Variovorax sp. J31P207]MDM0066657.1 mechanosensitive ion channel [Variovorax sp. J31P207]